MKGLTKPDFDSITFGWLRKMRENELFNKYGKIGYYGKINIAFIPIEDLDTVKEELKKEHIFWSEEREKAILAKHANYELKPFDVVERRKKQKAKSLDPTTVTYTGNIDLVDPKAKIIKADRDSASDFSARRKGE